MNKSTFFLQARILEFEKTLLKKKNIFIFIFIPSSTRPTHPYHTSPPNHHHSITPRPVTVSGLLSTKARTSDQVSSSTSGRRQISIWLPSLIFLGSQTGFIPREFGDGDGDGIPIPKRIRFRMLGCVSSLWEFPWTMMGWDHFSRQFLKQTHWDGKIVLKLEVRAHHWSLVLTASSTPHDWRKNPPKTPNRHPDPRDKVSVAMATTVNEWVPWPVYRYKKYDWKPFLSEPKQVAM